MRRRDAVGARMRARGVVAAIVAALAWGGLGQLGPAAAAVGDNLDQTPSPDPGIVRNGSIWYVATADPTSSDFGAVFASPAPGRMDPPGDYEQIGTLFEPDTLPAGIQDIRSPELWLEGSRWYLVVAAKPAGRAHCLYASSREATPEQPAPVDFPAPTLVHCAQRSTAGVESVDPELVGSALGTHLVWRTGADSGAWSQIRAADVALDDDGVVRLVSPAENLTSRLSEPAGSPALVQAASGLWHLLLTRGDPSGCDYRTEVWAGPFPTERFDRTYRLDLGGVIADGSCGAGGADVVTSADGNLWVAFDRHLQGEGGRHAAVLGLEWNGDRLEAVPPVVVPGPQPPSPGHPGDVWALDTAGDPTSWLYRYSRNFPRYSEFTVDQQIAWTNTDPAWVYAIGDYHGDGDTDLYAIDRDDDGATTIQVLDSDTGWTTYLLDQTAPLGATSDERSWSIDVGDYDGDGRDDLFAIDWNSGGYTAVRVLDAASGFQDVSEEVRTALTTRYQRDLWSFHMGDYDGDGRADLWAVDRHEAGQTAVRIMSAASEYGAFVFEGSTILPATNVPGWEFDVGQFDNDGRADLFAFTLDSDGYTQVNVVRSSWRFSTWGTRSRVSFPTMTEPTWHRMVAAG